MSSLIEGYNYDIFISYRQKDNKGDRWVSEFVDSLRTELESTFKEEISVYFDINPHDGLLETHDVDESLKDKMKCLVFIPIISRTYCDPNSFAWEHEFKAFVKLASEDQFGLKVKLPNGNVTNRVLPIRIHDLDNDDIKLCEEVLGGVLRSVDFIYKSAGVNRPLLPKEENPQENLNHTNYRDQINKVANAIKEIITTIGQYSPEHKEISKDLSKPISVPQENRKKTFIGLSTIALTLIILGFVFIPKLFNPERELEKSIAVLPFINDSPNDSNIYFINGIMDEILNNLQKIGSFSKVLSRTSTEQYRGTVKPSIPKIAKELDVNYIVEGSGQKYGNSYRLRVQLIEGRSDKHLWADSYGREIKEIEDIYNAQIEIARSIAAELKEAITPEEIQLIKKVPTTSLAAYNFYLQGKEELSKFIPEGTNRLNPQKLKENEQALKNAFKLFSKALECDTTFALAYTGLARIYSNRWYKRDSIPVLADKALSYDKQLFEACILKGRYFSSKGDRNRAVDEYDKALKINPNSWEALYLKGFSNTDLLNRIVNLQKAASLNHGFEYAEILYEIARVYRNAGFYEKSKNVALEVLKLNGDSVQFYSMVSVAESYLGNKEKALELRKKAYAIDSTNYMINQQLRESYWDMQNWKEMVKYRQTEHIPYIQIGYAYLKMGNGKEAENIFDRQMKVSENNVKLHPQSTLDLYTLACLYALKGDRGKAYDNLKRFNLSCGGNITWIELLNSPFFDSIKNEPEFKKIGTEMEAKFQVEHERIRKWLEENKML